MPNQIPPSAAPSKSANDNGPLTPGQVKALKIAIGIMSFLIVAILIVIVARVIYLATSKSSRSAASPTGTVQATTSAATTGAPAANLAPEHRLALPAGAKLDTTSLHGNRLVINYRAGTESRIRIVDLVTGKTLSEITITTSPSGAN